MIDGNTKSIRVGLIEELVLQIYPGKKYLTQDLSKIGYAVIPGEPKIFIKGLPGQLYNKKGLISEQGTIFSFYLDMEKRHCLMWQDDIFFGIVFDKLPRIVRPAVSSGGSGIVTVNASWNCSMTGSMYSQMINSCSSVATSEKKCIELKELVPEKVRGRGRSMG